MKGERRLALLIELLRSGAASGNARISTGELARSLGISQQSASRWLGEAEKNGDIGHSDRGIRLTKSGLMELGRVSMILKSGLEGSDSIEFRGKVSAGVGDGRYYLGMKEYAMQFEEKLGIRPFPGTLNIHLSERQDRSMLRGMSGTEISGFRRDGRRLGAITCFGARLRGLRCFVSLPERSHYGPDVIEVISEHDLRRKLKLKDGDEVKVKVAMG
ncbi:MAG: DUF120 domain-containing protein [Candidatus Micrarchaeota archaeon]|nr:DUF120 domain-containing protein [Candidatus Micrarchaeota archaeon]